MGSPILVDRVLVFELEGNHLRIKDDGGDLNFALTKHAFFANLHKANKVAAKWAEVCGADIVKLRKKKRAKH